MRSPRSALRACGAPQACYLARMRDTSLDQQLRSAIANKRLIEFVYSGAQRVAEPHDYGVQKERPRLLVYQLRSASSPSAQQGRGWRLLDVEKIERLQVLDAPFPGSRGDAHQSHYAWDVLYARV